MQIIRRIKNWEEVRTYLSELNYYSGELSRCALGRKQFWMPAEPNYKTRLYEPGKFDQRLWDFLKQVWPEFEICQVYGGNVGIGWHRDASYAMATARIFNMGTCQLETEINGQLHRLELSGGEVIEFNSKHRHRCVNPALDRYGIGMWRCKIPLT
jgi:hypothetical protein